MQESVGRSKLAAGDDERGDDERGDDGWGGISTPRLPIQHLRPQGVARLQRSQYVLSELTEETSIGRASFRSKLRSAAFILFCLKSAAARLGAH